MPGDGPLHRDMTDGGLTQVARHESSADGLTWTPSMDVTLRKVTGLARVLTRRGQPISGWATCGRTVRSGRPRCVPAWPGSRAC